VVNNATFNVITAPNPNGIATSLGFSHSTVRQESIAIYKALNIEGRTAIAERARELRLI